MQQNKISRRINTIRTPECHLDEIEKKLSRGLIFSNYMSSINQENIKGNNALLQSFGKHDEQMPRIHLVETADKYIQGNEVLIDCESRHDICKGVCCKFWFALSTQDVNESDIKWDYMQDL